MLNVLSRSVDALLLDAELRHFREKDEGSDTSDNSVLPFQLPTISRQVTELAISCDHSPSLLVKLAVDAGPGCGGVAWPAGQVSRFVFILAMLPPSFALFLIIIVLANYLLGRKTLRGLSVLELGSGTGLVGIVAGMLHAERVWVTDQEPLLDLMKTNVSLNGLDGTVNVSRLDWGAPLSTSIPSEPDLILAADCVYFEPAFPLLVQTLSALATSSKTEILFCYKKRRKADKQFFALLKKEFTWNVVADDPRREEYARESIFLYRLLRKEKHR